MEPAMSIKTQWIEVPAGQQTFRAWLAAPEGGQPRPGVLVLQEIFGANSHIRSVAERLAEAGYVALAPDLFWRVKPGIELGYTPDDIAQGREVRGKLKDEDVMADVKSALTVLAARPECKGRKQGVVGFCWGGTLAYLAATRMKPAAAASYYGGAIVPHLKDAGALSGPIMYHFGETDANIPLSDVEQIKTAMAARKDCPVHVYGGAGHGFHCDQRGSYHAPSAATAWQRTMEFFGKHLA
jgi:carboxymethylenebutenolidase